MHKVLTIEITLGSDSRLLSFSFYFSASDQNQSKFHSMMQEILTAVIGYALVGVLWGCSNPFIKRAQTDTRETSPTDSKNSSVFSTIWRLLTTPKLLVPFLINQSGSFVYYYLLSSEPVSRASPICNSLTFLFTALTGYIWFGEEVRNPLLLSIGIAFVLVGVCISVL